MNLVVLSQSLVEQVEQYPVLRNLTLRLLEILSAPDEAPTADVTLSGSTSQSTPRQDTREESRTDDRDASLESRRNAGHGANPLSMTLSPAEGVAIEFADVSVEAGGHTILSEIALRIGQGEHLAVVGPSGAGKSSLGGLLLGWHKPAAGRCLVDGEVLDGARLYALRRETAWVDPAIQVWNRSLLQNLTYGNTQSEGQISAMLEQADLFAVLEQLPEGLQTSLGEGGGLVSGGEGQRVRLARAMGRPNARLVILDEPFRGLDREKRRVLLKRARTYWQDATLICITHDVGETQGFDRVVVIENGRIAEDDAPAALAAQTNSRYNALLRSEGEVRRTLWEGAEWRRLWQDAGRLSEVDRSAESV